MTNVNFIVKNFGQVISGSGQTICGIVFEDSDSIVLGIIDISKGILALTIGALVLIVNEFIGNKETDNSKDINVTQTK